MAGIDWPSTLPQEFSTDGYNRPGKDLLLVSSMDVGPPKVRRRTSDGIESFAASITVSSTQLGYFKTFFYTTILAGSLRFNHYDPDDGTTAVEMMIRKWSRTPLDEGSLWRIDMEVVIMP